MGRIALAQYLYNQIEHQVGNGLARQATSRQLLPTHIASTREGQLQEPLQVLPQRHSMFTAVFHTFNTGDAVWLLDGLAPKRGRTAECLSRDQDDVSFPG